MRVHLGRLLAAVLAMAGVLVGVSAAYGAGDAGRVEVPGDTIVRVTGDAANGFGIYYYDRSSIFPPTDSEAFAECSEYDRWVRRVRCRTKVRVWYRDLADMKQALRYANTR